VAGRLDEAVYEYRQAIQIDPSYGNAHNNLGSVLLSQGKTAEASREFRETVRLQPQSASGLANLAWVLATAPRPADRDAGQAVDLAERVVDLTGRRDARALDVLAAAYASGRRFDRAQEAAASALRLMPAEPLASEIRQRQDLYRQGRPYVAPDPGSRR
jgi:Flp pilus assembly protein TadD